MRTGDRLGVLLENPEPATLSKAENALKGDERIRSVAIQDGKLEIELVKDQRSHHFIIELLVNAGVRIESFSAREVKLEDAFLKLTKGAVQ